MAINTNSVSFMKEYLKHAVAFEKNVYVWSHAMNEVNSRMTVIYEKREKLEAAKEKAENTLAQLSSSRRDYRKENDLAIAKCKKKSRIAVTVMIVAMLVMLAVGLVFGVALVQTPGITLALSKGATVVVISLAFSLIGTIGTGIVPICLGVSIRSKRKVTELQQESKNLSSRFLLEQRKKNLKEQVQDAENEWVVTVVEESVINEEQDKIHEQMMIAQRNLAQIYSMNVIPVNYRNFEAVSTFYEYLETGRCDTIKGHGGIYDTYEVERIQIEQLRQQIQMNNTLLRIEDTQRMIYREMEQANETLSGIKRHLGEIEKTNAEIAKNTAISAAANKQTADAAQWMAWRAWANGY